MCFPSSSRRAQAFSHSSWAGFQENKRTRARPLEAWAQNRDWHSITFGQRKSPDFKGMREAAKLCGSEKSGHLWPLSPATTRGTSITAILNVRNLRPERAKMFCPNYATRKWKSQDLNSEVSMVDYIQTLFSRGKAAGPLSGTIPNSPIWQAPGCVAETTARREPMKRGV